MIASVSKVLTFVAIAQVANGQTRIPGQVGDTGATTGTTPYSTLPAGTTWIQATTYQAVAGSNTASSAPAQVCGGVTTGVTSYQLYKCIPTRRGNVQQGSQQYSVTYSNLGPTPMITVYVDEYSDNNCRFGLTVGQAPALFVIPAATNSVCLSGTSYTLTTYPRTPTQDGLPPLVFNTLVTGYYASQSDCATSGVAPVVITAIPVGNTGGIGAGISTCSTNINPCTAMQNGNQLSSAPLYGYTTGAITGSFQPFTPFATQACGTNTPAAATNYCFAGSEQMTLESGEVKSMEDIEIGDRVLAINSKGEQVYSDVAYLPHGRNEQVTTFAVISTESGRDVKMTMNHILPAGACSLSTLPSVTVSQVTVGDCVQTVSGREQVVSIGQTEGKGIYTVIAMEELIVVNGIVATPYGGVNPIVANIYYNMHRVFYATFGKMSFVQEATENVWNVLSVLSSR